MAIRHIHIISPSGAISSHMIENAAMRLRAWGYAVTEGPHARCEWGRFAGSDEERLSDLCAALADPEIDLILCSRGGYGLQRIIDRVPPIHTPILGFSDITALHQWAGANHQPTIHGIMCKHIGSLAEESEALQALQRTLAGEDIAYTLPPHPLNRPGSACGPIFGGNLSVLYGLQGTSLNSGWIGEGEKDSLPILLIEDVGERHYHIDRMMRNLRMSGLLASIGGLIVGQFSECEEDPLMPNGIAETIMDAVADYSYPVLFDAPIGHVNHNMPLWLHTPACISITAEKACISIPSPIRKEL